MDPNKVSDLGFLNIRVSHIPVPWILWDMFEWTHVKLQSMAESILILFGAMVN